jgi:crotonobetainyl-CoA:carnitine CoA-transferase CaiB-like acyl-CoA transferase
MRVGSNGCDILAGYKVLDFTQIVAGPTTTRLMAEMGAEVIKVEMTPKGDPARLNAVLREGRSAYFFQHNLGKKSLCVNLKTQTGQDLIRALIPYMDVVVENFSPGVIARMGLGYEDLKALNPRLIMCSISALGQTGPLAHVPGYDYIAQAYSGITDMIGEPDGSPVIPMTALGDVSTGVHALAAIACALLYRERSGQGQYIDISLLDTYIHFHDFSLQLYSASKGKYLPTRGGAHHIFLCPCGVFRAKEGYLMIAAVLEHQWRGLTEAMGRPELFADSRFSNNARRLRNKNELLPLIENWLQSLPDREAALSLLDQHRVPAGPVLSVPEVIRHPHLLQRRAVRQVSDETLGEFFLPGFPFRFSAFPQASPQAFPQAFPQEDKGLRAPDLGEHNQEVLSGYLGYAPEEVQRLTAEGILVRQV